MKRVNRRVRGANTGPLDHWEDPRRPGVAMCGETNLGLASGGYWVIDGATVQDQATGRQQLQTEAVDCPLCAQQYTVAQAAK